ncbi:GTP cyclohydrolase I FolE [Allofrancisella guangzhouensis]|uniref:GTP cyclohydrolase 1 n=1 Tax=Allofrancisella guangzhouensis TaxID=594679 RepID=A0A0A8E456_9GAMM|nr:GTP cyclohydrolase I FolE [Allofrancisella guangzhouensis]AJC48729.1 GTP cyclohydrolase [Allofrancisella guangzhouensis]MBK2027392.1 GTP cyclohydrolase I FolE [Allofrancisella guangzhouensis]MBK2043668.1 GTP cyclohydrolase I FolE [Allofrancisella guangzhouensis]MBK2045192.1 GTP cyclohydrolase I FolE [Allofrancisella guangzhouensis]
MQQNFKNLITAIGENPNRNGLIGTPQRAAKAFSFLTRGYQQSLKEVINGALFESSIDEMVVIDNIEFFSLCEHHLLPFTGICHIAYLPTGKVLGLSKFARIVDMFAQRLQIQEQLTEEIATAIQDITGARGVGVVIEAKHFCMMMRGVRKQNSIMKTSVMLGEFKASHSTRSEFLALSMK